MEWGGEDWGSFGSGDKTRTSGDMHGGSSTEYMQAVSSLVGESKDVLSCSLAAGTEVKIKISKKQLEKLLKEEDIEGLSVQQVLDRLMNSSDGFEPHQRSWKPALERIPE